MDIGIDKGKNCIEATFYCRDHHPKLGYLLFIFLLFFGVPFLIAGINYPYPEFVVTLLLLLSPLFFGLLWATIGKQRLSISQDTFEISESIGNFVYHKKVFSMNQIESMHLHYGIVKDCCEGTENADFEGLVFTVRGGKKLKPFNYLNEKDSRHLQEKIKGFLNLKISSNCSCAGLKITDSGTVGESEGD